MIEALVAMCLVTTFSGEPLNSCWLDRQEMLFRDYASCRKWGDQHAMDLKSKSTNSVSVVSTVACVVYSEKDT